MACNKRDLQLFSSSARRGGVYGATGVYGASTGPDGWNSYLGTILKPETYDKVGIPDLDMTQSVIKNNRISRTIVWRRSPYEMMILYLAANHGDPIRVFIRTVGQDHWDWLEDIPLAEPLQDNYRSARLVSSIMHVKSATVPAGAFSINGTINGVRCSSIPPFMGLGYETVLSYAQGAAYASEGDNIVAGQTHINVPSGSHQFWVPKTNSVVPISELVQMQSDPGQFDPIISTTSNQELVTWLPPNSPPSFGSGENVLLDPCWEWVKGGFDITIGFVSTVTEGDVTISIEASYFWADGASWLSNQDTEKIAHNTHNIPANFTGRVHFYADSPWRYFPQVIHKIVLRLEMSGIGVGGTMVYDPELKPRFWVHNASYYQENSQQPVNIAIIQGPDARANLVIAGCSNHEVVPDNQLSRNVKTEANLEDPLEMECAEACIALAGLTGNGLRFVLPKMEYKQLSVNGFYENLCTGSAIYGATSITGVGRRLKKSWDALDPGVKTVVKRYAKEGARSVLIGADAASGGMLTPFLPGALTFLSSPYQSSDPPQPNPHVYQCTDQRDKRIDLQGATPPFRMVWTTFSTFEAAAAAEDDFGEVSPYIVIGTPQQCQYLMSLEDEEIGPYTCTDPFEGSELVGRMEELGDDVDDTEPQESAKERRKKLIRARRDGAKKFGAVENYFPMVPPSANQSLPAVIAKAVRSNEDPGMIPGLKGEGAYVNWTEISSGNLTVLVPEGLAEKFAGFFGALIKFAAVFGTYGRFYLYLQPHIVFEGASWQLAATASLFGFMVPGAALTGGAEFLDAGQVSVLPVGDIGSKVNIAKAAGLTLICSNQNSGEVEQVMKESDQFMTPMFAVTGSTINLRNYIAYVVANLSDILLLKVTFPTHEGDTGTTTRVVTAPKLPAANEVGFEQMSAAVANLLELVKKDPVGSNYFGKIQHWWNLTQIMYDLTPNENMRGMYVKSFHRLHQLVTNANIESKKGVLKRMLADIDGRVKQVENMEGRKVKGVAPEPKWESEEKKKEAKRAAVKKRSKEKAKAVQGLTIETAFDF